MSIIILQKGISNILSNIESEKIKGVKMFPEIYNYLSLDRVLNELFPYIKQYWVIEDNNIIIELLDSFSKVEFDISNNNILNSLLEIYEQLIIIDDTEIKLKILNNFNYLIKTPLKFLPFKIFLNKLISDEDKEKKLFSINLINIILNHEILTTKNEEESLLHLIKFLSEEKDSQIKVKIISLLNHTFFYSHFDFVTSIYTKLISENKENYNFFIFKNYHNLILISKNNELIEYNLKKFNFINNLISTSFYLVDNYYWDNFDDFKKFNKNSLAQFEIIFKEKSENYIISILANLSKIIKFSTIEFYENKVIEFIKNVRKLKNYSENLNKYFYYYLTDILIESFKKDKEIFIEKILEILLEQLEYENDNNSIHLFKNFHKFIELIGYNDIKHGIFSKIKIIYESVHNRKFQMRILKLFESILQSNSDDEIISFITNNCISNYLKIREKSIDILANYSSLKEINYLNNPINDIMNFSEDNNFDKLKLLEIIKSIWINKLDFFKNYGEGINYIKLLKEIGDSEIPFIKNYYNKILEEIKKFRKIDY